MGRICPSRGGDNGTIDNRITMKQRRTKKREQLIQEIDRMIEQNQHEIGLAEQKKSNRIIGWLVVINAIIFTIIWLGDFK